MSQAQNMTVTPLYRMIPLEVLTALPKQL